MTHIYIVCFGSPDDTAGIPLIAARTLLGALQFVNEQLLSEKFDGYKVLGPTKFAVQRVQTSSDGKPCHFDILKEELIA